MKALVQGAAMAWPYVKARGAGALAALTSTGVGRAWAVTALTLLVTVAFVEPAAAQIFEDLTGFIEEGIEFMIGPLALAGLLIGLLFAGFLAWRGNGLAAAGVAAFAIAFAFVVGAYEDVASEAGIGG